MFNQSEGTPSTNSDVFVVSVSTWRWKQEGHFFASHLPGQNHHSPDQQRKRSLILRCGTLFSSVVHLCVSEWGITAIAAILSPTWQKSVWVTESAGTRANGPSLCVHVCDCRHTAVLCARVNVFVTDSPSPDPRLSSSCTMSRVLKHGAVWWQADRRETMCCNLWGALPQEEWWVIKRKTLRDTAGAQLQATGCVYWHGNKPLLWFSDNMGPSVSRTHRHTLQLFLIM